MIKTFFAAALLLAAISASAAEPGWKHESSAGVLVTTGNAPTQTFDVQQKTDFAWDLNALFLTSSFLRASARSVESAYRWTLGSRYERSLAKKWGIFVGEKIEGDKFAGFLQRYSTDVGGRYSLIDTEATQWKAEAGYRYQYENRFTGATFTSSLVRLYSEAEKKWNESLSTKLWAEYLQSFSLWNDQYLNAELSLNTKLSRVFSLKTGYLMRYRRLLPPLIEKNTDTTLTMALVAKF